MCGIAGLANRPGLAPDPKILDRFCTALAHRGPDGHATAVIGATGLAHTRLAIIDIPTGQQPLAGPMGTSLIGNGEIYNYLELWPKIEANQPRTHSDFEVPLHLVARCGPRAIESLRGMYAFAAVSADGSDVTLARDPFGIKPLYYAQSDSGVAFASEPQALISAGVVKPSLNPDARDELVALRYTNGSATIFNGIQRALPGETIVVRDGVIAERSRRDAILPPLPVAACDEAALVERFDAILEDSVEVHRRADVPLGLFLSAGLDSTALLVMLARLGGDGVPSFTAGFEGAAVPDERPDAARIARLYGAEHINVGFTIDDFWQMLPAVAAVHDDPTADYAILPTFKLAAVARQHGLKVVLSGEGGDELFGGYGRYRRAMRPWWLGGRVARHRRPLRSLGLRRRQPASRSDRSRELGQEAMPKGRTRVQQAQAFDIATWLPNDILLKLDRCLMAHGVEGRTPFLDREVARFAFHLPDGAKVKNGLGKWLVRRWMEWRCPAALPYATKSGFTVPVQEWMARRKGALGLLVARQPGVAEMCRPEAVRALFENCEDNKLGLAAWGLLFYAVWHTVHFCEGRSENDVFSLLRAA